MVTTGGAASTRAAACSTSSHVAAPYPVRADGTIVTATDHGAPWFVLGGVKHRFLTLWFSSLMGYPAAMRVSASSSDLDAIPTGARLGDPA